MKRSEINTIMRDADAFIRGQGFHLPPFAYWTPDYWAQQGEEAREITERMLGWDITDFGQGDFANLGLFLFTVRNGTLANLKQGKGKVYAEKIMICNERQVTPLHYHWVKTEDIINRGGGRLVLELYNAAADGKGLAESDVTVNLDGVWRTIQAGGKVVLNPGESITLEPYWYHGFWAEGGRVLVGEVSTTNDDLTDNCFYQPVGRFPTIEEDVPPLYLLVGDYERFYTHL
ncbi:MAG: D-lyxose/D-mannose family sugar isomerase [Anaerolineae bacterium]|nr:D-lyxose/D-mannose family sugar isomerase [Anaerolineae bacterium]